MHARFTIELNSFTIAGIPNLKRMTDDMIMAEITILYTTGCAYYLCENNPVSCSMK